MADESKDACSADPPHCQPALGADLLSLVFLRGCKRIKDGKEHLYWSIVENRRLSDGRVAQRHVLYLGELNHSQEAAWQKTIGLVDPEIPQAQQVALFPEDRAPDPIEPSDVPIVRLRLDQLRLERPRQWGACWLASRLWEQLELGSFWSQKLPPSREGTRWDLVLKTLVFYRLIDPGSEWRLHRHWFDHTALSDLIGVDFSVAEIHRLYECHDKVLAHKTALFDHLSERWKTLFQARYDVLLYDLTSTYFESPPREDPTDQRRFGYSRDKRADCVQVVIALVLTPEGFPMAYEVMAGNTSDKTTLKGFLEKIEKQYGQANRTWLMDRGIPTEEVLQQMREHNPAITYVVGTPKGRLSELEKSLREKPWQQARTSVEVKVLAHQGEAYVFVQSKDRVAKERSMRRRRLRAYLKELKGLQNRKRPLKRDDLREALGGAKKTAGRDARWVKIEVTLEGEGKAQRARLDFSLRRDELRKAWKQEGRYLLRTNLKESDGAKIWNYYLQLAEIEEAFKDLKGDLALRPIHHQLAERIQAHILISFLAYSLHVTLKARLRLSAAGLTPRAVLEKLATVKLLDVHIPTTDNREIVLTRYTQPEKDLQLLLDQLKLQLPDQLPPRIHKAGAKA